MRLSIDEARTLVVDVMTAVGHTSPEAKEIADHLIDCELRGLSFGGLPRALSVVERIRSTATPQRAISIVRETPVSATIDGGDRVGYLVANRATDIAIDKARSTGLAMVGAHETWYTGMFSYYLERITAQGFAGMIAGSGLALVAPHGGTEARFGTNPIAFGFPATHGPVICDIGTAGVMLGEVALKQRLGELLPPGLAFDKEGHPTQNAGEALEGAFTVWGGHKGSGLALVVQLLGMMCGAEAAPKGLRDCGFFVLVMDPGVLNSAGDYQDRVTKFADDLRATRPLNPEHPVRVPFDRSRAERVRRLTDGYIDVSDTVFDALGQIRAGATRSLP